MEAKGRFTHEAFVYEAQADAYRCPNGKLLKPTQGRKINTGGRVEIRYVGLHWPTRQMMVLGETQRLTKILAQSRKKAKPILQTTD